MPEPDVIQPEVIQLGTHFPTIRRLLNDRTHIPGDVAEFGVYNGASTIQIASSFPSRTVWAFDTFTGIPSSSYTPNLDRDEPGKFRPPQDILHRLLTHPNINPVKGLVEKTISVISDRTELLLVYLDLDLFLSTEFILKWLPIHLTKHSAIVVDDFATHPGIRMAVKNFLAVNRDCTEWDGEEVIYWKGRPNGTY